MVRADRLHLAGLLSSLLLAQVLFVNISHQLIRKIVSKCLFPLTLCVLFLIEFNQIPRQVMCVQSQPLIIPFS
jgi:hypothetical protein